MPLFEITKVSELYHIKFFIHYVLFLCIYSMLMKL